MSQMPEASWPEVEAIRRQTEVIKMVGTGVAAFAVGAAFGATFVKR